MLLFLFMLVCEKSIMYGLLNSKFFSSFIKHHILSIKLPLISGKMIYSCPGFCHCSSTAVKDDYQKHTHTQTCVPTNSYMCACINTHTNAPCRLFIIYTDSRLNNNQATSKQLVPLNLMGSPLNSSSTPCSASPIVSW